MTIEEINQKLFSLSGEKKARRDAIITPGAKPMLGAKIPDLRKIAKQVAKENYRQFLEECPDDYFEQQFLQAAVLGYVKDDIETLLSYADKFIPKIQDWAVCDGFCQTFSVARKHRERVWKWLVPYAETDWEFPQRVVAVILMSHFLTDEYIGSVLDMMNRLKSEKYYTKMGVAWCVATAYAKYPKETHAFLLDNDLDAWTYNKSIQKMLESFRVSARDKEMLREMKVHAKN